MKLSPFQIPTGAAPTFRLLCGTLCGLALTLAPARAADSASAQITSSSLGGGEFGYTITLKDTGTGNLETFWYSWVPGEDFMPVSPTDVVTPTGWTDAITHGGSTDGYAIQFVTSTNPLAPNGTDIFTFESTATPAQMAADSPFYTTTLVDTAFVYSGAPFSDAGDQFVVQTAPEPSGVALFFFGVFGLGFGLWRRRRPAGVTAH